jgi:spermidine/putrescine transport system substrate-binding protein
MSVVSNAEPALLSTPEKMKSLASLASLLAAALLSATAFAKPEINLFAWSEYVPQELIEGFTKSTGIAVNYETYASNEEMLSKLLAGGSSYDLVQPTDYMAEAMIREKLIRALDLSKLPLLANIDPAFKDLPHDPGFKYSVPYMSGTVGIVINSEKIKGSIKGYKDVFQPAHAGRIVVLNDNRELATWALSTLGVSCNDITEKSLAQARPVLKRWLPMVKLFDSDSPKTALLNGDVDLGIVWSGEAAILWNENKKFIYVLPEEGCHRFVDLLCIPSKSRNPEGAHAFINYILRPEVSKLISDKFPYTNPNTEARKLLSVAQLANPASYPNAGKLASFRDIGKGATLVDKLITDLKSSN